MLNDNRLKAIFNLLPDGGTVADIGTDHGKLGCELLTKNKCRRVWFTDISAPSLEKARLLAAKSGVSDRAEFFVGDGCEALPGSPDAAVIAGMGGGTIIHILENGLDKLRNACLVLGPQSELTDVRLFLSEHGLRITEETAVREADRLYVLIRAEAGEEKLDRAQLILGPCLRNKTDENARAYFELMFRKQAYALECCEKAGKTGLEDLKTEVELWKSLL